MTPCQASPVTTCVWLHKRLGILLCELDKIYVNQIGSAAFVLIVLVLVVQTTREFGYEH